MGVKRYIDQLDKILLHLFGFQILLWHGDTLVMDRWRWLQKRIGLEGTLLDVGCGSGAFTIGLALHGINALGLSWDDHNNQKAINRANTLHAWNAKFKTFDIRYLKHETVFHGLFDLVICCEVIEHIIDDECLMKAMAYCLRPGGRLLLTSPNDDFRPMYGENYDVISSFENGEHVRRGYTMEGLKRIAISAGLTPVEVTYCSGIISQYVTGMQRRISRWSWVLGYIATLPLRLLTVMDPVLTSITKWPQYSICLEAQKPLK